MLPGFPFFKFNDSMTLPKPTVTSCSRSPVLPQGFKRKELKTCSGVFQALIFDWAAATTCTRAKETAVINKGLFSTCLEILLQCI